MLIHVHLRRPQLLLRQVLERHEPLLKLLTSVRHSFQEDSVDHTVFREQLGHFPDTDRQLLASQHPDRHPQLHDDDLQPNVARARTHFLAGTNRNG